MIVIQLSLLVAAQFAPGGALTLNAPSAAVALKVRLCGEATVKAMSAAAFTSSRP